MKKHLNLSSSAVILSCIVATYVIAYLLLVRREPFSFDGRYSRFIPTGSLHQVERYRFQDDRFIVKRIFLPAHTVDVILRPRYWSSPDNQ